jgi:hypothetical protein
MTFYEFYRVKEVCDRFFKDLTRLKVMDNKTRTLFSGCIRQTLDPLLTIRNTFTHSHMAILKQERKAWVLAIAELSKGAVIVDKETGNLWEPAETVGEVATKVADEITGIGESLFSYLQNLNNRLAKAIVNGYKISVKSGI